MAGPNLPREPEEVWSDYADPRDGDGAGRSMADVPPDRFAVPRRPRRGGPGEGRFGRRQFLPIGRDGPSEGFCVLAASRRKGAALRYNLAALCSNLVAPCSNLAALRSNLAALCCKVGMRRSKVASLCRKVGT